MPSAADQLPPNAHTLARRIKQLERDVRELRAARRLANSAIDSGALVVRDDTGSLRAILGQQADGTTAVNITNGPTPPTPTAPTVEPALAALAISWDGLFTDATAAPLDWMRCEVHVSDNADFEPDQTTLRGTIESPQGGTVTIPLSYTTWWVKLRSRSTSGVAGAATAGVSGTPRQADASDITADAITGKTITGGTISGTDISGGTLRTNGSGSNVEILTSPNGAGVVQFPSNSPVEGGKGYILSTRNNTGAANEYLLLNINSPNCAAPADGKVQIQLNSQNADGSSNPNIGFFEYRGTTQTILATVDKDIFRVFIKLISDGSVTAYGGLISQPGSVTNAVSATVNGDAYYRYVMDSAGKMTWGPGSAARDTNLYRSAANTLATDDNLTVGGILNAKSIATGSVSITPSAIDTPTSIQVTGLNVAGSTFLGYATANTTVPGDRKSTGYAGVTGVSVSSVTSTGLLVWVNRQNTTATTVNWMVIGS